MDLTDCILRTKGKILNQFYNKEKKEYSFKNFLESTKNVMYDAKRDKNALYFTTLETPVQIFEELCDRYPNEEIILEFRSPSRGDRQLVNDSGKMIYKDEETVERELAKAVEAIDMSKEFKFNCTFVDENENHNYEEEAEEDDDEEMEG